MGMGLTMNHTKQGRRASRLAFYDGEEWSALGRHADAIIRSVRRKRRRQLRSPNPWLSASIAENLFAAASLAVRSASRLPDGG